MAKSVSLENILRQALSEVEAQIQQVRKDAENWYSDLSYDDGVAHIHKTSISPYTMKDANGQYILVPLLTAKANVLLAITMNNDQHPTRRH